MSTSKDYIKRVAVVGAGGNSGRYMAEALVKTGKHVVTAITRANSTTELPEGVEVKTINYDDQASIVDALRGQDALIITMGVMAPKDQELKLIKAAAEAGVPWVLPNEYGPDTTNEKMAQEALIAGQKKEVRQLIEKLGKSSWIGLSTGFWYEWSLAIPAAYGIDIANHTATFIDEGETQITTSTWPQVGRAVASLLSLKVGGTGDDNGPYLEQFKNSCVYVSSFTISQKEMLDSVMRVTKTSKDDWKVTKEPSHERYQAGLAAMKNGDRMGFAKAMYTRVFFPDGGGNVGDKLSDDVLGLPKEDLDEATQRAIERSKVFKWGSS